MKRYHVILWVLAIFVLFAAVSIMDAEAEGKAEHRYCDMVEQGAWGEYRGDVDCGVEND